MMMSSGWFQVSWKPMVTFQEHNCSGIEPFRRFVIRLMKHSSQGSVMQLIVRNILVGAVLAVAALATAADAADPVVGTWTLNVAQSKFTPGHELKSQTRTYTESAKGVSVKVNGVGADGSTLSQQSTFKYDGKSYPMS